MTNTIGNLLISIKVFSDYNEEAKNKIIEFYAANDEIVKLPDTLEGNGALVYEVTDSQGNTHKYNAFLRDVSLEASLKDAA